MTGANSSRICKSYRQVKQLCHFGTTSLCQTGIGLAAFSFTCLIAMLVGLVSAGIVGSLWELMTGEEARIGAILDRDPGLLTPLRAAVSLVSAPSTIMRDAMWWMIAEPFAGVPLMISGLVWSFLQGVFILTQVFNIP